MADERLLIEIDAKVDGATKSIEKFGQIVKSESMAAAGGIKALDKQTILSQAAEDVRKSFTTGDGAPAYKFVMLVHADVKKHKYVYWFGFPAWNPRATTVTVKSARPVTPDEKDMLVHCMDTMTSASLSPLCRIREGSSGDLLFLDPSSSPQHPGWPLRAFLDWIEADCALYCVRGDVYRAGRRVGSQHVWAIGIRRIVAGGEIAVEGQR